MDGIYTANGIIDKNAIWARYSGLVRKEVLRLQLRVPASVDVDDLIQAGAMGLLGAIDDFDPAKELCSASILRNASVGL